MFEDEEDDFESGPPHIKPYKCPDEPDTKKVTKTMEKNKLYEIKTDITTLYGHKLAVNSQGQWVMEVKGTGAVLAVCKTSVQEVLPYTIGVQFNLDKTIYHYLSEEGKYQAGDICVMDAPLGRAIVQVVSLDTKNPSATKVFDPLAKLLTA
jgi:hypothetical protein